jgi:hypothetical protein
VVPEPGVSPRAPLHSFSLHAKVRSHAAHSCDPPPTSFPDLELEACCSAAPSPFGVKQCPLQEVVCISLIP